jgi:hypothetical protein
MDLSISPFLIGARLGGTAGLGFSLLVFAFPYAKSYPFSPDFSVVGFFTRILSKRLLRQA